jgi:hypothetical protein
MNKITDEKQPSRFDLWLHGEKYDKFLGMPAMYVLVGMGGLLVLTMMLYAVALVIMYICVITNKPNQN